MATITLKLYPFTIPNYVVELDTIPTKPQDGFKAISSYHLKQLDEDTLSTMCDEFRQGVFAKAGKNDPKHP